MISLPCLLTKIIDLCLYDYGRMCAIVPMTPSLCCGKLSVVSKEKIKEKDHVNPGGVANQQIVMNLAGVVSALLMITVVFSFFLTLINFCGFFMIPNKEIRMS
jgi:hypothetical protein